jgi:D-3-phosphoglycerate dehydrogenase
LGVGKVTFKILICDKIADEGIELLEKSGYKITKAWGKPKDELPKIVDKYDALIVRSATKVKGDLIANAKTARVIGRAGIGLDNIDVEKAEKMGITVVNTPQATAISVAELAFGHLLALARNIVKGTVTLRDGKWAKKELQGVELYGKTLGLIGYGNIGKIVEKMALAFGMKVVVVRSRVYDRFVSLDEMLPNADFVSIHVPLAPQTRNMLSTREFDKMKKGVMIIDCSRGGVVDQKALYEALVAGKVKAAAIDVFEQEPPGKHKLFELENVYATPHIGAQTKEAQLRTGVQIAERVIEELEKFK